MGIQYLSNELHSKLFPRSTPQDFQNFADKELLSLSTEHLRKANLLGKKTQISEPIEIPNFPDLVGQNTLDEHFSRIGSRIAKPYTDLAEKLLHVQANLPPIPTKWELQSGWTRYAPGQEPEKVDYPLEDGLVFDVEVLYKVSPYPVLATAASPEAWYSWVSPVLTNETPKDFQHLIPMATHSKPKLVVGYNVSYDRARMLEEYNIKQSKAFFLDAMALHIAISGFCSQQRPLWHKHKKHKSEMSTEDLELDSEACPTADEDVSIESQIISPQDIAQELMDDPWLNKGSTNSLASAAEFHCGIQMNKDTRNLFSSTDLHDIKENFQDLMAYCATDVDVTYKVAKKLYPEFREKNPHPVSFAALKLLGTLFCPTTTKWQEYIENAESVYQENRDKVNNILRERAQELIEYIETGDELKKPNIEKDPWLMHLNWTLKEFKIRKDGTPYAKQAFLTGYPEWYRELFKVVKGEDGELQKEMNLTVRTRVTPYLLRLKWEGYPLVWTNTAGWCFKVPAIDEEVEKLIEKKYTKVDLNPEQFDDVYSLLREGDRAYELFRVPHPEGPKRRCTLIMTKSYLKYFESGELSSEYDYASEILTLNATASYWMGNRARIMDQFVVYADTEAKRNRFFSSKAEIKANKGIGMIIPKFCTMGTVTRRATENTWLTASNSKSNRIGSELKAMVTAPKDYVFVGADVDSEELWIASLIGDSMFKLHGSTALGWMTLEGDKCEKTDLHSRTADIMGILRNDAKIFNYGRIYGAGVKFATQLLQKCSNNLSDTEAAEKAKELYTQTKGLSTFSRVLERRYYHGGTESVMFNALETIAQLENPRTPVLGASITDALTRKYLNKNNYLTSRINWAIQSSGVDYLHLLIVSMEYLIDKFGIDARLMITVHDELRYMVRKDQSLQCALLLQISNLWTRGMFCEQLGIKDVPQSCAFFSEVDIDHVLRKEVGMSCVTPSHPDAIPPGDSYSINKLLDSFDVAEFLGGKQKAYVQPKGQKFIPRTPVMGDLDANIEEKLKIAKLRLQNASDKAEWTSLMTKYMRELRKSRKIENVNLTGESPSQRTDKAPTSSPKETRKRRETKDTSELATRAKPQTPRKSVRPTKKEPPKAILKDEESLLSKDGDEMLLQELAQARTPGKPGDTGVIRNSQFGKLTIRHIPFARSYSGGYGYSRSGNWSTGPSAEVTKKFLGPLFSNIKQKPQVTYTREQTAVRNPTNSGEVAKDPTSNPRRQAISRLPHMNIFNKPYTKSGSPVRITRKKSIIPYVSVRTQAASEMTKEDGGKDQNFRRRRNGAVYESEYRFGRGHRRRVHGN